MMLLGFVGFKWWMSAGELIEVRHWVGEFGIGYRLNLGGLSLLIISLLYLFLFYLGIFNEKVDESHNLASSFLILGTIAGVVMSTDLILFYLFFASLWWWLILLNRSKFGYSFYLPFMLFDMLLLVTILYGGVKIGSFSLAKWYGFSFPIIEESLLFWGFLGSCLARLFVFPFHTGFLNYTKNARSSLVIFLVMSGFSVSGLFAIYRFIIPIFKNASLIYSNYVILWAVISIVYGLIVIGKRSTYQKMIALIIMFESELALIGLFSFQEEAVMGSLMLMPAIIFGAGLLLSFSGRVVQREGFIVEGRVNRWFLLLALIFVIGLPPSAGFVWGFYLFLGSFQIMPKLGAFMLLALWLWLMISIYYFTIGGVEPQSANVRKNRYSLIIPLMLLVLFGVYPRAWISFVERETRSYFNENNLFRQQKKDLKSINSAATIPSQRILDNKLIVRGRR